MKVIKIKILRKIIIIKDGKEQEFEEEVPLEFVEEIKSEEKQPETKDNVDEIIIEGQPPKEPISEKKKPEKVEMEELPAEQVTYKIIKSGTQRNPITKVVKKRKIVKYGKKEKKEEQNLKDKII